MGSGRKIASSVRKQKRYSSKKQQQTVYYQKNGIKPYSKKSPLDPERIAFRDSLNEIRSEIRSQTITITHMKSKIPSLQRKLYEDSIVFQEKKQINLQTGRLVSRFHMLMKCSPKTFPTEMARLQEVLSDPVILLQSSFKHSSKIIPNYLLQKLQNLINSVHLPWRLRILLKWSSVFYALCSRKPVILAIILSLMLFSKSSGYDITWVPPTRVLINTNCHWNVQESILNIKITYMRFFLQIGRKIHQTNEFKFWTRKCTKKKRSSNEH